MPELDPNRWKALTIVCAAFFMTVLDVSIVNVALPSIGKSLQLLGAGPPVGDHRVRDHLRRVPPARRARRRPARTAPGLLRRRRRLHDRVVPVRARVVGRRADRGARRAGLRRRDHHAGGALDHHDQLRGGRRSATRRSASGARSAARAPRSACSPAASSRSTSAGNGSSSSTSRSVRWHSPSHRGSCARAAPTASTRTTSQARSRSPPGSRCSSTPSPRRRTTAGARPGRSRGSLVAAIAAARVPRDRIAGQGSADAVPHLPRAHGRGRERRRSPARRDRLRELLPADAVRAAGAPVVGAQDGRDVRRHRRHGDPLGGRRAGARHASRRQTGDGRGLHRPDRGHDLVHADPGARVVRIRPAAGIPARRLRASVHVRPGVDRGARRRRAARGRSRIRTDQHGPAGRRRDRGGRDIVDLDQPLQPLWSSRARRSHRRSRRARNGPSG